jgi:hypothetical protein
MVLGFAVSEQELEKLAKEFDALHEEVFADLGDGDRRYIKAVISVQRQIIVVRRLLLLASRSRTAWVLGTACLATANRALAPKHRPTRRVDRRTRRPAAYCRAARQRRRSACRDCVDNASAQLPSNTRPAFPRRLFG